MQISNTMDTASLVSQLIAVERIPQDQLRTRVSALQSRQGAWNQIGSQVTALQNAADALAPVGSIGKLMSATTTNDAALGVRVTGVGSPSTTSIEVLSLAATHSVVSTDSFADADASDGGRTLTLNVGGTTKSFTSADGTIGGLADAINAGNSDVKAKLLQTAPDTYKLVLSAAKSGADAAFTASGSGWSGFTTSTTGANAQLKVDGVTISRSSNIVSDLVPGVELTLRQPTTAAATVTVTRDDAAVVDKIKALVDAANNVINNVKKQTATSATASARGVLAGDSSAIALADQIRGAISAGVTGTDGVKRSASVLGISLTREGTITFDAAKLRASLADDPAAVVASLGRGGSSSISGVNVTSVQSTANPGPHAISVTQIASASALVGVPIPPPPAGSTINMTVTTPNGTTTVTFAAGSSFAQTAANLTQAMIRSGLSLEASTDGSALSIIEKRQGSKNTFSISGVSGTLGIDGAATPGNDAVVKIDGTTVTGTGRSVAHEGTVLSVGVTATQLANASGTLNGTFQVTDGLAGLLARVGGKSTTSAATTAKTSLDSQIKDLQNRIDRYDDTLKLKETALRAKFTAMDQVLTNLQGQMSSLASFLTTG